jgi:transposase
MWTASNRRQYERAGLRYPSDLTEGDWALVERLLPPATPGGRRRTVDVREVLNAIFYVLSTGCQWRALPKDLPPRSTANNYLGLWAWDGTLERIHEVLFEAVRAQEGRPAEPGVAIIDSQSVRGAEKGGRGSIRRAMTRTRRSRARSAILSSTRSGWH